MSTINPKYKLVTVAATGTPVPVFTQESKSVVSVIVQATTNKIYVGDGTTGKKGILLDSATNDKIQLTADAGNAVDLAKIYIDSDTNGGTASVVYFIKANA